LPPAAAFAAVSLSLRQPRHFAIRRRRHFSLFFDAIFFIISPLRRLPPPLISHFRYFHFFFSFFVFASIIAEMPPISSPFSLAR